MQFGVVKNTKCCVVDPFPTSGSRVQMYYSILYEWEHHFLDAFGSNDGGSFALDMKEVAGRSSNIKAIFEVLSFASS